MFYCLLLWIHLDTALRTINTNEVVPTTANAASNNAEVQADGYREADTSAQNYIDKVNSQSIYGIYIAYPDEPNDDQGDYKFKIKFKDR